MLRTQAWTAKLGEIRQIIGGYRCLICSQRCSSEPALCASCLAILPWLEPSVCLCCGVQCDMPCQCSQALNDVFRQRIALFDYAFPVDALLKRFKYQEKRFIGRNLGLLLGKVAMHQGLHIGMDRLLPIPLAWPRRRARGFNQSADLAQACSELTGIPWSDQLLSRTQDTPRLAGLAPVERRFALLGAFNAQREVYGQHIVLVDDVLTSGATCLELHRELSDRGAASVSIWTIARTVAALEPEKLAD